MMPCMVFCRDDPIAYHEAKHEWAKVVLEKPRPFLDLVEVKEWFGEQIGYYHAEALPTLKSGISEYRFWFSDDNTAFAFKIRWA
ncbi:MAG: hypothetical protein EOP83_24165 [Verrucomicrobiaceae bacterium]|nr:MAG: hypothetical protein EOP83_24165 [Verrucomicrobiaceae bacterium]